MAYGGGEGDVGRKCSLKYRINSVFSRGLKVRGELSSGILGVKDMVLTGRQN